jgi:hypothetical protein
MVRRGRPEAPGTYSICVVAKGGSTESDDSAGSSSDGRREFTEEGEDWKRGTAVWNVEPLSLFDEDPPNEERLVCGS